MFKPIKPERKISYTNLMLYASEITFTITIFVTYLLIFFKLKNNVIRSKNLLFFLIFYTIIGLFLFVIYQRKVIKLKVMLKFIF